MSPTLLQSVARPLWWVLRALALVTLAVVLWPVSPLLLVALVLVLGFVLYALRAPDDLPGRPQRVRPLFVVVGDLTVCAALLLSVLALMARLGDPDSFLLFRGPAVGLVLLLLAALALRWSRTPAPGAVTDAEPRSPVLVGAAVAVALLTGAGFLTTLGAPPDQNLVACGNLWKSSAASAPEAVEPVELPGFPSKARGACDPIPSRSEAPTRR